MSVNAVKGVEIGDGFATAELTGEVNADEIRLGNDGKPLFLSNHVGRRLRCGAGRHLQHAAARARGDGARDRLRDRAAPADLRRNDRAGVPAALVIFEIRALIRCASRDAPTPASHLHPGDRSAPDQVLIAIAVVFPFS